MLHQKNPRVAEEADYSQFLVVLNFPFVFQNTHIPVLFYKLIGKAFLEIGSRPVFSAKKISSDQNNTGQIIVTRSATTS